MSAAECERAARRISQDFLDLRGASFVSAQKIGSETLVFWDAFGLPREHAL